MIKCWYLAGEIEIRVHRTSKKYQLKLNLISFFDIGTKKDRLTVIQSALSEAAAYLHPLSSLL